MSELYGFRKNLERVQVRSKADSVAKSNVIPALITDTPVTAGSKNVFVDLSVPDLANWNVVVLRCRCVNAQQNIIFFRGYTTQNYLVDSLTSITSRAVFYVDWDNNRVRVSWTHGNVSLANSIQILAVYGLVQNVYAVEGDDTDEPSEDEEDIDITALTEEVQGIRIGADGTIYDTAGDAVRGQYEQLAQILENLDVPAVSEAIEGLITDVQEAVDTAIAQIEQSGGLILDDTLTQSGEAADAKVTGDEINAVKEDLSAINTATASDEGKALKAKTVTDGKVTEWEFGEAGGGETYYTTNPSANLCDYSGWTDSASAPYIPVEYGKTYSANFNAYNYAVYMYDANKTSLGNLNQYNGLTLTKGTYYDGVNIQYTYEITAQNVAYIRTARAIPTFTNGAVPMFVEGTELSSIPIAYNDVTYTPKSALSTLKSVMLDNYKVALGELESTLLSAVKQLGYSNWTVNASDLYNFDAETSSFRVYDGIIQVKSGITSNLTPESLYFDKNVHHMAWTVNTACTIILQDNINRTGIGLAVSKTGIDYLVRINADDTKSVISYTDQWTSDNTIVSIDVVRNADNYVVTFVDSEDVTTVKTFTFAYLGITDDPGRLGINAYSTTTSFNNGKIIVKGLTIGAESAFATSSSDSASRLYGKTWDAWGDSFTDGSSTYVGIIEDDTGCTATNLGTSGYDTADVLSAFNSRSDACGSYVTVFVGVNDFLHDTTIADFQTSVESLITAVIAKAPSSKFGYIVPPQTAYQATNTLNLTLEDYVDEIITLCRKYSIPVLDLYHEGGWYTNSAFTAIYISGDNLHPSSTGQALLADKIQMFLERL